MEKYFQGAEEFSVRDFGRSMHYFQGRGNTDPPGASFFLLCLCFKTEIKRYNSTNRCRIDRF